MIWKTNNLPCSGVSCSCDKKSIGRDKLISKLLDEKYENPPFVKNNHNLRAPNVLFEFTKEEEIEYEKSKIDINYFYNKSQNGKRKLYKIQEEVLCGINKNKFSIIINSRQSGIGYTLSIKALHKAIMSSSKRILIISNNIESSQKILNSIKDIYQTLPFFIKSGIITWNTKSITFDNGSRIVIGGYGNILGSNWDLVILNDYAFFTTKKANKIFNSLIPVLSVSLGSELVICSVPNGDNHFRKIVEENNFFKKYYVRWSDIPNRDDNWVENMIKIAGIPGFAQQYDNLFFNSKEWNRYINLSSLLD